MEETASARVAGALSRRRSMLRLAPRKLPSAAPIAIVRRSRAPATPIVNAAWAQRAGRLRLHRLADFERSTPDRLGDVLNLVTSRSLTARSSRDLLADSVLGSRIPPGSAMPCGRAAILTPSPSRSPSLSSTTSPRWIPTRTRCDARAETAFALDHAVLDLDGATHGINHAAELDDATVACALHHATMMDGDGGIDQIAAECP